MTLIVGIKCSDGLVLAADGAATFGAMGQQTIRQSVKKKLEIVDNRAVVGVSGPVGLGQRFVGLIHDMWQAKAFSSQPLNKQHKPLNKPHLAMQAIREQLWRFIEFETKVATVAANATGPAALQQVLSSTMIAIQVGNQPCLFTFDAQASPEEATEDLPFVSIGSGQLIADPFLAFLRRLFWPDRLPDIAEGKLAAVWTIRHAIQTSPGGIGEPIQVVQVSLSGSQYMAKELADDVETTRELITRAEDHIRGCFDDLESPAPSPAPPS